MALAVGLAGPAHGAIAGVPEEPRPGTLPGAWLQWSNDSFGGELGENSDDYRTNGFNGGVRLGGAWVVALDYSMLTHLETLPGDERRSDELTATLGYRHECERLPRAWLALGAGVRVAGDLGGESVQNAWHDLWDYDRLAVPYEDGGTAAVVYAAGGWSWIPELDLAQVLDHRLGMHVSGAILGSSDGEFQAAASLQLAATGRDASFWIGLREQVNRGSTLTTTAAAVAGHEDGTWLTFGTSAGAWSFEGGTDLHTRATVGRIGFMWRRGGGQGPAQVAEIEGVLGLYAGYALGVQYRWRPSWLEHLSGQRAAVILDYRFGQYPGMDWNGNNVVVRQPLVGVDLAWAKPRDGFQLMPFAYLGAGVREERVESTVAGARFPDDRAVRAVVQGGIGLRCYWGDLPRGDRTARYGVSLVYDLWQPLAMPRSAMDSRPAITRSATVRWDCAWRRRSPGDRRMTPALEPRHPCHHRSTPTMSFSAAAVSSR
jgi:hypothetical protein